MTASELDAAMLALPGVSRRYAFNGEGYYIRARLFAFLEPGGIVMRIPEPQRGAALNREGTYAFTMPRTSLRHDWIFVPFPMPRLVQCNKASADAADAEVLNWATLASGHVAAMNG